MHILAMSKNVTKAGSKNMLHGAHLTEGGAAGSKAIAHMETTHFNKGLHLVAQLDDLCIVHWLSF